jgi:hypothetical protein
MLSYDQIKDKPRVLLSFTGLTQAEFEELSLAFALAWHKNGRKNKNVNDGSAVDENQN